MSRQSFAEIEDFMEEREISYLTGIKNDVHFLQKSWIYVGVGSNATHGVLDSCLGENLMHMELLWGGRLIVHIYY